MFQTGDDSIFANGALQFLPSVVISAGVFAVFHVARELRAEREEYQGQISLHMQTLNLQRLQALPA